ncbi:fructose 1,6-bisphosphatase [Anaeromyxobacter sp. SG66]|uniref:fructose 1,6-bisphosphatase n=1 Tax=Anaeromyxobacter sp. SG66 TaxID=2925410 RepID=UPI001F58D464|nr:fructose 1,6-bisphosphatase [Anaeromyxobacter sp. SG66]
MKLTLSVIEADLGSVGGHLAPPSPELVDPAERHVREARSELVEDVHVARSGEGFAFLSRAGA